MNALPVMEPRWWLDPTTNLLGVLLGAIIAAWISHRIALRSSREVLARDHIARIEAKKSAVFRASVALLGIVDVLFDLHRYVSHNLGRRNSAEFADREPWQLVMPMVGFTASDVPVFDADSLAVLFEDNEYDLMQKMGLLQRRCASAQVSFLEYCRRRDELRDRLPPPVAFEGKLASIAVTRKEALALMPYTVPLNDLLLGLESHLEEDRRLTLEVLEEFQAFARKLLNMPGLTLEAIDDPMVPLEERSDRDRAAGELAGVAGSPGNPN